MTWYWDAAARVYRNADTGEPLTREEVLAYVDQSTGGSDDALAALAALLMAGQLSQADFDALSRAEIEQEYLRQYMLAVGGREQMTAADWAAVGALIAGAYGFLSGFMDEISAGDLSEAAIAARLGMYANGAREAFWAGMDGNAGALGMDEEAWHLGAVFTEHCDDCVAYQAQGWKPINTFPEPGDGSTQCLTNCKCHKTYRNSTTGATY